MPVTVTMPSRLMPGSRGEDLDGADHDGPAVAHPGHPPVLGRLGAVRRLLDGLLPQAGQR